jgi:hypothetical protein
MSDSANVALVRRLYDSGMAPEVTKEVMAPDLVWDITPGFPNSGVYHGWDNVAKDFFGVMMPSYASFGAVAEELYGADDHVVVYGHYQAGEIFDAPDFLHALAPHLTLDLTLI